MTKYYNLTSNVNLYKFVLQKGFANILNITENVDIFCNK